MTDPELRRKLGDSVTGHPLYTVGELMEATGTDRSLADELWLSLGFATPGNDDVKAYTESDAESLRSLNSLLDLDLVKREQLMAMTRVMGQTLSRLAAAQVEIFRHELTALVTDPEGVPLDEEVRAGIVELLVPGVERFVSYCWRRHLLAALDRDLDESTAHFIGFVDLVDFTRMTRELDAADLAELVARFEAHVYDAVTSSGARMLKLLGDGVMFDAPDAATAASATLSLVLRCAEDPKLNGARGGLAVGPTLAMEGDVYGETVNRAKRLAEAAYRNTVLADADVGEVIRGQPGFSVRPLQLQKVKGLGKLDVVVVRPALG